MMMLMMMMMMMMMIWITKRLLAVQDDTRYGISNIWWSKHETLHTNVTYTRFISPCKLLQIPTFLSVPPHWAADAYTERSSVNDDRWTRSTNWKEWDCHYSDVWSVHILSVWGSWSVLARQLDLVLCNIWHNRRLEPAVSVEYDPRDPKMAWPTQQRLPSVIGNRELFPILEQKVRDQEGSSIPE